MTPNATTQYESVKVQFRCTENERRNWHNRADACGLSLSSYIRTCLDELDRRRAGGRAETDELWTAQELSRWWERVAPALSAGGITIAALDSAQAAFSAELQVSESKLQAVAAACRQLELLGQLGADRSQLQSHVSRLSDLLQ